MNEPVTIQGSRWTLRRAMRRRRRELPATERSTCEIAIRDAVRSLGAFRSARRIAIFFAFDGEPALGCLMTSAAAQGKQLYLPIIRGSSMTFAALRGAKSLVPNEFGIFEPRGTETIDPRRLDLVLTPLVAFDAFGTRIGVGRAYYDRCFAFLANRQRWRHPKLLGIAFGFQQVDTLEREAWDVPLWGVATEAGIRTFAPV